MNILLIGSGARELAVARALARSVKKPRLFCCGATYNRAIAVLMIAYEQLSPFSMTSILEKAKSWRIELAFIGPEQPLALGLADLFWRHGIACIGPTQELAQVETSKIFTRSVLHERQVCGAPRFQVIHNLPQAQVFLKELGSEHFVIKPDGLTSGKGVKVAGIDLFSLDEALTYGQHLLAENKTFLIEEKLKGQEFSLHCFSDGKQSEFMPVIQDFKRLFPGDKGPNTGSMGSLSYANHRMPFLTEDQFVHAQELSRTMLDAVQMRYRKPYKGILYGSFIATEDGVKLIEFNARFGDPEAINILALLESDLVTVAEDIVNGCLGRTPIHFASMATVCKYLVPQGYPHQPLTDQEFRIGPDSNPECVYLASHHYNDQRYYTSSSRTLAVLGIGKTLLEAEQRVALEINNIIGPLYHRHDIGLASSDA
jgi:phosphoribosylamine--glycine ligase